MSKLLLLPDELLMKILDREELTTFGSNGRTPPPIKEVIKTCRLLYTIGTPLFYRSPRITSLDTLRKLFSVLDNSRGLSAAVKNLQVLCNFYDPSIKEDFLSSQPKLFFPTLPNCICLHLLPGSELGECRLHLYTILQWTTHCPSLCTLHITDFSSAQISDDHISMHPHDHGLSIPPTLERLEISVFRYRLSLEDRERMWPWFSPWLKSLKLSAITNWPVRPAHYMHGMEVLGPRLKEFELDTITEGNFPGVLPEAPTILPNLEVLDCQLPTKPIFNAGLDKLRVLKLCTRIGHTSQWEENENRVYILRALLDALRRGLFPKLELLVVRMWEEGLKDSTEWTKLEDWCIGDHVTLQHRHE